MEGEGAVKRLMLQRLIRSDVWGGKHTPLDFVMKGLPEHYRNAHKGKKTVERALKELANDGWIAVLAKRTGKGSDSHISLNPRKAGEIRQFLQDAAV